MHNALDVDGAITRRLVSEWPAKNLHHFLGVLGAGCLVGTCKNKGGVIFSDNAAAPSKKADFLRSSFPKKGLGPQARHLQPSRVIEVLHSPQVESSKTAAVALKLTS